jgi:hypothetical protein
MISRVMPGCEAFEGDTSKGTRCYAVATSSSAVQVELTTDQ